MDIEDCYVEVIVEEGSTKAKVRVRRALNALIIIYGLTADYESLCKQVGVMYANTEWFLQTVAQRCTCPQYENSFCVDHSISPLDRHVTLH
jgi:hypothetical protein